MPDELVQPLAPPAPEVAPTAPAAPEASQSTEGLPDALLKQPAFQGLLVGQPGAVSASISDFSKRAEAKLFIDNKDTLLKAGFGIYRALDGNTGVIFNRQYVHDDELKQADAAGQLAQLAPPFDDVDSSVAKSGINHPALDSSRQAPTGFKGAPMPAVPQSSAAPAPPPASVQNKLSTARIANMQPGSPTSGPVPGAGRLLNQVLKPVI